MNNALTFKIRENENGIKGLFGEGGHSFPFLTEDELKNPDRHLYLWAAEKIDKLFVKFGYSGNTVFERWASVTGSPAVYQMIKAWPVDIFDKPIHKILHQREKNDNGYIQADPQILNTTEAYEIISDKGLLNLIQIIDDYCENKGIKGGRNEAPYDDILVLIDEIFKCIKNRKKQNKIIRILLNLCARYGKTRTTCEIIKRYNELYGAQIAVMCSYVGTVAKSYSDELGTNERYKDIMFVNPDDCNDDDKIALKEWLKKDPKHCVMYYVAMTGSKDEELEDKNIFQRRTNFLSDLKEFKSLLFVEEADFGSHCVKQAACIRRLNKNLNCEAFFGMTGTNAERILKIFPNDKAEFINFDRDYMLDVLTSPCRTNPFPVKIKWHVLDNSLLAKIVGNNLMENWKDIFEIGEDGRFKEEMYLRKLVQYLFNGGNANIERKLRKISGNLIDRRNGRATEIFVPNNKELMKIFETLIYEELGDKVLVRVINGDETTNRDAEAMAKNAIKDAKGRHVIFIASEMGNRSFSVSNIKNIVLLINNASYSSITQKTARAFTPDKENRESFGWANIIDFRLTYAADTVLSNWLGEIGIKAISGRLEGGSLNEIEYLIKMMSSDKIIFDEYTDNEINPIRKLGFEELSTMMHGDANFLNKKASWSLIKNLDNITEPTICEIDEQVSKILNDTLHSNNIKGDQTKKTKLKIKEDKGEKEKEEKEMSPEDKKIQHWLFLLNKANVFISEHFKYENKDVLFNNIISMSEKRKLLYKNEFGIDMNTITDIVKILHADGFDLDVLLERYRYLKPNENKILLIKSGMNKNQRNELYNAFQLDEKIQSSEKICLEFLGNSYFYQRLIENGKDKNLIYIIDDKKFEYVYADLDIPKGHIKLVDPEKINDHKFEIMNGKIVKFDKIIMNPPYSKNLHLKILKEASEHLNDEGACINLSPIRWLQDPNAKFKKGSDYNKFEDNIAKHIKSLDIITTEESNKIFNIGLLQPLGIYTIIPNKQFSLYKKMHPSFIIDKIFTRIIKDGGYAKMNICKFKRTLKNFVIINIMAPPMKYGRPMFDSVKTWCGYFANGINEKGQTYEEAKKACSQSVRGNIENDTCVYFDTEKEVKNCYQSMQTMFVRFVVMKAVVDVNVDQQYLPWMGDAVNPRTGLKGYLSDWTDDDFRTYFNITDDEWQVIETTMEKYK